MQHISAIRGRWLTVGLASITMASVLYAQQPAIQRVLLQRVDVPQSSAGYETVMGTAEIQGGGHSGRHSHPGTEMGYVLNGEVTFEVDGEPARTLKAGDSYLVPAGKIHDAKATGNASAKVVAVYVVEKGKPMSTAAP